MPQTRATTRKAKPVGDKITKRQMERIKERQVLAENCHIKRSAEMSPEDKPMQKRTALGDKTNAKLSKPTEEVEKKLAMIKISSKCEVEREVIQEEDELSEHFFDASDEQPGSNISIIDISSSLNDTILVESSFNDSVVKLEETAQVSKVPEGVIDFDKENWLDPFSASPYAMDIFNYLKKRESKFVVRDYMIGRTDLSRSMRSVLVDWMVEVQENFELNHETLYMAVKLTDLYLQKADSITKDMLQLVGATAIFICSKFEERHPPMVEDFLYICDDAYTNAELTAMEVKIVRSVDFDIGFPLSYSFLRRYGRCHNASMDLLTLSRYILETSLLCYEMATESESLLASAAFLLSLKMTNAGGWTPALEYYSGYTELQLRDLVVRINSFLPKPPTKGLQTIYKKYSHKVFYEVASIPLLEKIEW